MTAARRCLAPARAVKCPTCKVGIGQACILTRGKHRGERAHYTHPGRAARAARMPDAVALYVVAKDRKERDRRARERLKAKRAAAKLLIPIGPRLPCTQFVAKRGRHCYRKATTRNATAKRVCAWHARERVA